MYGHAQTLTLAGMLRCSLKAYRIRREKNGCLSLWEWSRITPVLKAENVIDLARDSVKAISVLPMIKSVSAGLAWLFSISLIQVLLHVSQTTLALQSRLFDVHSVSTPCAVFKENFFFPGKRSFIQSLTMCSADNLAVCGQNAHSFIVC